MIFFNLIINNGWQGIEIWEISEQKFKIMNFFEIIPVHR